MNRQYRPTLLNNESILEYMQPEKNEPYVVVVGAANLDILGFSHKPLIPGDSNPGRVRLCTGGVGRNIAENLALLGISTELITVSGGDIDGEFIRESCISSGIGMDHSLMVPDARSSTYMAIMDSDGDMSMALSDLSIIDNIDEKFLLSRYTVLSGAGVIVADTNLSVEALSYLAKGFPDSVICADAVSTTKAEKLIPLIGKIHTLKMNRIEAGAISGLPSGTEDEIRLCGESLLKGGTERVFITLGNQGVYWCSRDGEGFHPPGKIEVVNTTGAGDAFMAGIVLGTLYKWSIAETLSVASAVASLTLSGEATVNPLTSKKTISEMADVQWN